MMQHEDYFDIEVNFYSLGAIFGSYSCLYEQSLSPVTFLSDKTVNSTGRLKTDCFQVLTADSSHRW